MFIKDIIDEAVKCWENPDYMYAITDKEII